jgi:threonine dehydratase
MIATAPMLHIEEAAQRLAGVVHQTPLMLHVGLSRRFDCQVWLKREDLQVVRSYKLRGAYNLMSSLEPDLLSRGVVCASAGNHAQGFAFSCHKLGVKGKVFMPVITPRQKIAQTEMFGNGFVEIQLEGDTFDDCAAAAKDYTSTHGLTFIPPFDHLRIVEGQGTVAAEILAQQSQVDFLFVPIGGGGLAAGCGTYFREHSPHTKIYGIEPQGAPSMYESLRAGFPVTLSELDRFVDGAAVKKVGDLTFNICRAVLDQCALVPEGRVCTTILKLYNEDAIVAEPAGALSIAALEDFAWQIRGKNVVCVVSGSNNDIDRMPEIKERSLQFEGLKHYFLVRFAQRPGALREFVNQVLGPTDDITRFEYMKKTHKETGPALVGIELKRKEDYRMLIENLKKNGCDYIEINKDDALFNYLI